MRHRFLVIAGMFVSACLVAHAQDVTELITVNTTGPGSSGNGPNVSASFTLTFDPNVAVSDQTAGLTVNSFSFFPTPPASSFNYDLAYTNPNPSYGSGYMPAVLNIHGPDVFANGTEDYQLLILDPQLNYSSQPGGPQFELTLLNGTDFEAYDTGTVTITPTTPTPEPGSLVLLGSGVLGAVGAARRRLA